MCVCVVELAVGRELVIGMYGSVGNRHYRLAIAETSVSSVASVFCWESVSNRNLSAVVSWRVNTGEELAAKNKLVSNE